MAVRPLSHVEVEMLVAQLGGWQNAAARITPHYRWTRLRGRRNRHPVVCAPPKWTYDYLMHEIRRGALVVYGIHRYFPDSRSVQIRPFTGETS